MHTLCQHREKLANDWSFERAVCRMQEAIKQHTYERLYLQQKTQWQWHLSSVLHVSGHGNVPRRLWWVASTTCSVMMFMFYFDVWNSFDKWDVTIWHGLPCWLSVKWSKHVHSHLIRAENECVYILLVLSREMKFTLLSHSVQWLIRL